MAELRWIFLTLHFTAAAAAGLKTSYVTVRDGDDVTLPHCAGTGDQETCDGTVWFFTASGSSSPVPVFECGKFHEDVGSKSDRLRLTEECCLVVEKVSADDAGRYDCGQSREGGRRYEVAQVLLSVVTMTEHDDDDDDDEVMKLTCSVTYDGLCDRSVQWLFDGDDGDENRKTSQFSCSDSVKIKLEFTQRNKLRCEVTDRHGDKELFEFKTQRTTAAATAMTPTSAVYPTTINSQVNVPPGWWWQRLIVVAAGLAGLTTSVLMVNIWMLRRKGNQPQTEENVVRDDDDADADEEEGVGAVNSENVGESECL